MSRTSVAHENILKTKGYRNVLEPNTKIIDVTPKVRSCGASSPRISAKGTSPSSPARNIFISLVYSFPGRIPRARKASWVPVKPISTMPRGVTSAFIAICKAEVLRAAYREGSSNKSKPSPLVVNLCEAEAPSLDT